MKTKLKKTLFIFLGLLTVGCIATILFSPFGSKKGFAYKLVIHSVEINAPADSVYRFLGRSSNAAKWSVFVNHINPLNTAEVPDGKVGCMRRCFKHADEQGLQWDEEIVVADFAKRRQLTVFNMKDFYMQADGLATEQIYEPIGEHRTRLSFTLFFKNNDPSLLELFKTYCAAYEVKRIYKGNMANIKTIIENGQL